MSEKLLRDKRLLVIFGVTFISVMGVASIAPALPQIAKALELNNQQVGLLMSVFTFPGIFLSPVAGVLADRFGRKTILIPSLFLFAVAGFALFFTRTFQVLIFWRIAQGVGAASLGALNATLIGDFFKGKQLPNAMGYNASVLSLSTASFPLIGGLLAGIAWYYPFVLPLLAIPVGLFVIFVIREPEIEKPNDFRLYLKSISGSILKKQVVAVFILAVLTFVILYGVFLTYLPFLLEQRFSFSSAQIGMFISFSSITTAIVATQAGKLSSRFGSPKLIRMAFVLYLAVTLLMPKVFNVYVFVLPILLFGTGQALNLPSLQTILAQEAPDNSRAIFMSMFGTVIRLGQTLGPLIIGIGFYFKGVDYAFYMGALMALVGIVVSLLLLKNEKR